MGGPRCRNQRDQNQPCQNQPIRKHHAMSTRLSKGGRLIDRTAPVEFSFNGKRLQGYGGDTLASALLANDQMLVGRSFKYHRPRGIVASGPEEPNALVNLGTGARLEPNQRATTTELFAGLQATSQNHWPSLEFDIGALNNAVARFLPAGFYYKTFIHPRPFWKHVFEPIIRRAAGLGALSGANNPDRYERAFAFCDVLVIGAGPSGLMAALTAARAGADVILADEDARMGGRLLAETDPVGGVTGVKWSDDIVSEVKSLPNVRLMPRTTIVGAFDHGIYAALERVSDHLAVPLPGKPRQILWRVYSRQALLCAGAIERPIAFANNDRPGVMLAGALPAAALALLVQAMFDGVERRLVRGQGAPERA